MEIDIIPYTYRARAYVGNMFYTFRYTCTPEDLEWGLTHYDCMMRDFEQFYKKEIRKSFRVEME